MCDPPYGTTACKWDSVLPFDKMWSELNRVCKPKSAIVLFGSEPFSTTLRMSNIKNYKYDWIWNKKFSGTFVQASKAPLKNHENVTVFARECSRSTSAVYYPIKEKRNNPVTRKASKVGGDVIKLMGSKFNLAKQNNTVYTYDDKFPTSVDTLNFSSRLARKEKYKNYKGHPTQKPVALLEYLVKTYSLENQVVLDFTMGSGSTGVACVNTNRKFIGIELEKDYFKIACGRISEACDKGLFSENEDAGTTK